MSTSGPDLTALVGSRICHDLISPLGAIGNGLELLGMAQPGQAGSEELSLIHQSVANANARVRFYRVAFGAADRTQKIARAELTSILRDSFAGGRIAVEQSLGDDLNRADAKLALLLVLCLETALPRGGTISVTQDGPRWHLSGTGPRVSANEVLWQSITSPVLGAHFSAAEVQFALLPAATARAGRALSVSLGESAIEIRF